MRNLKFKVLNTDSIYTILNANYKIKDYLYPVDYYWKNKKIFILAVHSIEGSEDAKLRFIKALKTNKKVKRFEHNNNQVITLIAEEEKFYEYLFSAEFYHPAPVLIENGYETWSICAWERRKLEKLMKEIQKWKDKFQKFELLNFSKLDFEEVYFPKIAPKLPEKQRAAFDLALKRGHYTWPRKVDLGGLARESRVSIPTFQENLRKAESKLLPFFSNKH